MAEPKTETDYTVVDLFAGPGGWDEGARLLGMDQLMIGIEWDPLACQTAEAAGHARLLADVSEVDPVRFAGASGLIASPPCQDFSAAGKKAGLAGEKGKHVAEVMRWARGLMPEWIACEQVPEVMPIWQQYAHDLRGLGYSAWCGVLESADYGVPQTRERAILMARRDGIPATPPTPTHAREPEPETMFGPGRLPWRTLGDATGRTGDWEVHHIRGAGLTERHGQRPGRRVTDAGFTVLAWKDSRMRWQHPDGRRERFTLADSLAVQGFPTDYPVAGSDTRAQEQIGNAIPPLLAAHILAELTGVEMAVAA